MSLDSTSDAEFSKAVFSDRKVELFQSADKRLSEIRRPSRLSNTEFSNNDETAIDERLFIASVSFKILTSQVSMHLDKAWRDKFFRQLDSLLDVEEWDTKDLPPTLQSFRTLIRALLKLNPQRKPGLGASSDGKLIAAWSSANNHLTLKCLPHDQFVWSVTRYFGDQPYRAAGTTDLSRLERVLSPYEPSIWFNRA